MVTKTCLDSRMLVRINAVMCHTCFCKSVLGTAFRGSRTRAVNLAILAGCQLLAATAEDWGLNSKFHLAKISTVMHSLRTIGYFLVSQTIAGGCSSTRVWSGCHVLAMRAPKVQTTRNSSNCRTRQCKRCAGRVNQPRRGRGLC